MRLAPALSNLIADRRASGTAEFALVLPILVLFLLGIIDIARVMYVINMAEKATQMGARYAIVTDVLPPEASAKDYVETLFLRERWDDSLHCW